MMRNGINSYLTSLVMVLALLLSANAFAAETVQSSITIDDEEYYLYTGFNVIAYTDGNVPGHETSSLVDGDISASGVFQSPAGSRYLEFSSDVPIILKGYIFDLLFEGRYYPTSWTLKAKQNEEDDWDIVSSKSGYKLTGMSSSVACDNSENKAYSYFYLEAESDRVMAITELRLYGGKDFTYAFRSKKSATCTETGIKQDCYFRNDGKYFTDETGTTEIPKEEAFDPIKPHSLIHHEEDDVHYEYWECSVCGKKFGDAEGSEELSWSDFDYVYTKLRKLIISSDNMVLIDFDDTHSNNFKLKVVGDVITFRVLEKYVDVNSIKVSDGINDYPITSEGNGNYSFTVPAADVTISVEKKPKYEGLSFFEIVTYVDRNTVTTDIFHSGLSTIRLNSGIVYDIYEGNNTYFNEDEGRFGGAHSGFSVPKTGWYDISFNEVGDGKWNLSISATTRKPQIETISDQVYTGEDIMPKPVVTLDLYDLTEGSDYEYSYSNNVNVGTATVTVTFKGDYAEFGSVSKSFNITKGTPEVISNPTPNEEGYAGKCLALVNPGTTNFGKLLYRTLEEESFSETIPCVDKTGDYLVYYMVEEGENWEKYVPPEPILVTVELAKFKVTFVDEDGTVLKAAEEYDFGTPAADVVLPSDPEKADDEMYAYTFAGWSPEIQEVTGAMTYSPIYGKTRIGFGSATIAADGSWAIIDGKSSKKIDADLDAVKITGEVTLNREFVAEKPSTIVLPFDTRIDNVPGFTFYSFKGVVKENGVWKKVVFDEVDKEGDGLIYANTPYIVVAKEDVGGLIVENGVEFDLNSVRPMSSEDGIWQFVGTYDFKVWNEGDRYIGRSYGFAAEERDGARIGQFVMLGSNAYAYPMRAYLYYAGGNSGESRSMAPALFKAAPAVASIDELPESLDVVVRGEEGTTVIGTINTRTGEFRSAENRWFDLNGRFLGNKKPTVKGTYYNNGKKVIVK